MATKIDFKNTEKELYKPSSKVPSVINVPNLSFLTIDGTGNPNSEAFQLAIKALYNISYKIKMAPRNGTIIDGFYDYVVPPLEGIWDIINGTTFDSSNKENLKWKIMIRQPEFVKIDLVEEVRLKLIDKDDNPALKNVILDSITDGLCCQMMHIGSFDNEPATFKIMEDWISEQGYKRESKIHREIYLSNFLRTAEDKLKTVLRFKVEE